MPSNLKLHTLDTVRRPLDVVSVCGKGDRGFEDLEKSMHYILTSFNLNLFLQNQFAINSKDCKF